MDCAVYRSLQGEGREKQFDHLVWSPGWHRQQNSRKQAEFPKRLEMLCCWGLSWNLPLLQLRALAAAAHSLSSTEHKLWSWLLTAMQMNSKSPFLFCILCIYFSQWMLASQPLEMLQLGDSSNPTPSPLNSQDWDYEKIPIPWFLYWDCTAPITIMTTKPPHSTAPICARQLLFTSAPKLSHGVHRKLGLPRLWFNTIQIWRLEVSHHKMHLVHSATHLKLPFDSFWSHYIDLKRMFMCWCIFKVSKCFLWLKRNISTKNIPKKSVLWRKVWKHSLERITWHPEHQGCLTVMPQMN